MFAGPSVEELEEIAAQLIQIARKPPGQQR
jgi:hypothetical protein